VQGILNLMGGKIWLEPDKENGSRFYFTVPFKKPLYYLDIDEPEDLVYKLDLPQRKVLIVEDNYFNAEYLIEVFSDSGIPYVHVKTAQQALEICSKETVSVAIVNTRMNDFNAFELIRQLKKKCPGLDILAQTTYINSQEKQKAMDAGCAEYYSSPIKQELLLTKINTYMQKSIHSF